MDEQKLKVILEAEIDDAIGYVETETVEQRTKAINYYNRYEYGNEIDGRSKIVTGEVAEVIDGALPQLMRIFTGSDELGRFEPRMPGDEEFAKQATELTNYVFFNDNDGVILMHNWMKDALLQKNGIVKYWWEDSEDPTKEEYKGLNAEELTLMFADDEMELISQETEEVGIDPMGMPVMGATHNVVVQQKKKSGKVLSMFQWIFFGQVIIHFIIFTTISIF